MRRILHVITTINRGGAENHLVGLVRGQVEQGLQVAVAYLKGDGYWAATLRELGVRVEAMELTYYGNPVPIRHLRSLIRTWVPDIIHAHMPPAELYTRLALLCLHPAPVMVISKHNDEPFFRGFGQRLLGRWVARRASRIIAISDAVNRYIKEPSLGCPANRTVTVHYGIDPAPFETIGDQAREDLRRAWSISRDEYVIGTVARLVPQKALHVLLDGFARYQRQASAPSRLVVVGVGPLKAELKQRADDLGIGSRVIWAGFREDTPAVMKAFDLFALTSAYEGFGLVLLEAMAVGLPVVATRVSAIPEVVEDRESGYLIPAGDPKALAEALIYFEDQHLRRHYGMAGQARVRRVFSLSAMIERSLEIYQEAMSAHPTVSNGCRSTSDPSRMG